MLCNKLVTVEEDFICRFIPTTVKFVMELTLGKRDNTYMLPALTILLIKFVPNVKITTLACNLQQNKKIKADKTD